MRWLNRIRLSSVGCVWLILLCQFAAPVVVAAQQVAAVTPPLLQQSWRDLQILSSDAMQGRSPGSQGSQYARDYLVYRYRQLGLTALTDSFLQPFNTHTGWSATPGINVAGYRRGCLYPQQFVVITAHYDHLAPKGDRIYNGADDNASGVAGLLYLAGLSAQQCPAYSQLFLATDAEETGLDGARAFIQSGLLANRQILLNINLDMISRGERAQKLYLLASRQLTAIQQWAQQKPQQQQVKLLGVREYQRLGAGINAGRVNWANASDHAPFRRAGIAYMYFGVGLHLQYHTADDDWRRVSPAFFHSALQLIAEGWQLADGQNPEQLRPALYQSKSN